MPISCHGQNLTAPQDALAFKGALTYSQNRLSKNPITITPANKKVTKSLLPICAHP